MKVMTAIAMLLVLGATAQAKVAPLESQTAVTASDYWLSSRSVEMREADYFRVLQSPLAGERFLPPCRLQHIVFNKTRLAQSCR